MGRLESRGEAEYDLAPDSNAKLAQHTGRTLVINDNEQRLFEFRQLQNSPIQIGVDRRRLEGQWNNRNLLQPVSVALAAGKHTDVLLLKLNITPPTVNLDAIGTNAVYARAAFLSFGSLVRKAACSFLDVQPSELRIGVRATTRADDLPTFELYMLDSLENGAGYCRHLAENNRLITEVLHPLRQGDLVAQRILAESHADDCDASCTDCLREYGNSETHPLLDWRLALDLVDLAIDANATVGLTSARWEELAGRVGEPFAREFGGTLTIEGGQFMLKFSNRSVALSHPIAFHGDSGANTDRINIFDLVRRPGQVISRLGI